MSKKRILGKKGSAKVVESEQLVESQDQSLNCPICNESMISLSQLNKHIDDSHLTPIAKTNSTNSKKSNTLADVKRWFKPSTFQNTDIAAKPATSTPENELILQEDEHNKFHRVIPRDHWKKSTNGLTCHYPKCGKSLGLKNGVVNCRKCGELYCTFHCKHLIKLNESLEIDKDGVWCRCCQTCFNENLSWCNVIGNVKDHDLSLEFSTFRKNKTEKDALVKLVLEKRVWRFLKWVEAQINEKGKVENWELSKIEKEIVSWKDEKLVKDCQICNGRFGIWVRKHHCRLCGDVVCGDISKGCSMIVPVAVLAELMGDENDEIEKRNFLNGEIDDVGIRVCLNCKKKVFDKTVMELDRKKMQDGDFMRCYRQWKIIKEKLDKEDLENIINDDKISHIVSLFGKLDKLGKEIGSKVKTKNDQANIDEIRLFISLKQSILGYVQEKLPILRKAQQDKLERERVALKKITDDERKLTRKEIREKRERLMVLNEQNFIVKNMYDDFKKQRKFDDLKTLDNNLKDLNKEIKELQIELGDEAF